VLEETLEDTANLELEAFIGDDDDDITPRVVIFAGWGDPLAYPTTFK
jgi:hypothetical protein